MLELFTEYIKSNNLFNRRNKVLLAVSGGVDSIVMLNLFVKAGYKCGVAHCNFKLRGEESNKDEQFVRQLVATYDLPMYVNHFKTELYAKLHCVSIQMAARELRYEWFEEIRQKYDFDYIATAHQQDDVVETFHINLVRGSGIRGFLGIQAKNNKIIRPILFSTKDEIIKYVATHGLSYREDATNNETKYIRNKIRHIVLPALEEMNPNYRRSIIETIERLKETEAIVEEAVHAKLAKIMNQTRGRIYFKIEELHKLKPIKAYLYEFFRGYGFRGSQIPAIISSLYRQSGKTFISATHRLVKDRNHLILTEISESITYKYDVDITDTQITLGDRTLLFTQIKNSNEYKIPITSEKTAIDFSKLQFPLIIRKWRIGDFFVPLGMKNAKKLSNFFIDQKLSILEKEEVWLLTSTNEIVWVIGQRLDDRYKITPSTKKILEIEIKD